MNRENLQKGVALVKEIDYISTQLSIWDNSDSFAYDDIVINPSKKKVDSKNIDFKGMKVDTMAILNNKLAELKLEFESLKSD
jgi:hypothetical protein